MSEAVDFESRRFLEDIAAHNMNASLCPSTQARHIACARDGYNLSRSIADAQMHEGASSIRDGGDYLERAFVLGRLSDEFNVFRATCERYLCPRMA